jgi:hypothetical protein
MNLLSDYKSIRKRSEDLCAPLEIEDYVPQSALFASPPKWNLAHTSWFFEEFILKTFLPKYKQYHPIFSFLFNIYYEGSGKRTSRNERGSLSRPTVKEVYDSRAYVEILYIPYIQIHHLQNKVRCLYKNGYRLKMDYMI